ncbi:MAG: Aminodeoxyfutalosine deaminase [Bacteroidia bacterium]|nr:Aminodeoxyfutalosine deaminase [Bacteroidia bacterium]
MRYLSADFVFPISQPPIKNGVVAVDDDGTIVEVHSPQSIVHSVERYRGILCPGFVNTHCHLELSHMKGAIPEKTGLTGFIQNFVAARKTFSYEQIEKGIEAGEKEMLQNGIVAVGDICNVKDTFKQKAKQNLRYYNFIEAFDFLPDNTEKEIQRVKSVVAELKEIFHNAEYAVVPHAPYSVSEILFKILTTISFSKSQKILSIHNQESEEENKMFIDKEGKFLKLFQSFGMDFSQWEPSGTTSLETILPYFSKEENLLLVHNTYSDVDDIAFAEAYSEKIFWCTCPNANIYIENKLPDYNLFLAAGAKITIGTDSLASNYTLSILDEMKTIAKYFPEIKLEILLEWATLNGSQALGFQNELGSFEKGKNPGVILIEKLNMENISLKSDSKVKRLV